MDIETLLTKLAGEAARLDKEMRADLAAIQSPVLAEVIGHAVFQGGKRVRPLLALLSARLLGEPPAGTVRLAIPFEYLHAASLLHDDVIDHADMRRGEETANRRWGNSAVILAGDYLHARAMLLAGVHGGAHCLAIISRAIAAMVEAEFLQMRTARERNSAEENYFAVLQGKTAALIAAACEVGMLHAGGDSAQCRAMRTYGASLGLAFQIIDDLLDYQGDPDQTGKAAGNDFQEGKMTLPLLRTLQNAEQTERAFVEKLLEADPAQRREALPRLREIMQKTGGFASAEEKAEQLVAAAGRELDLFADSEAKAALQGLARYVLTRKK